MVVFPFLAFSYVWYLILSIVTDWNHTGRFHSHTANLIPIPQVSFPFPYHEPNLSPDPRYTYWNHTGRFHSHTTNLIPIPQVSFPSLDHKPNLSPDPHYAHSYTCFCSLHCSPPDAHAVHLLSSPALALPTAALLFIFWFLTGLYHIITILFGLAMGFVLTATLLYTPFSTLVTNCPLLS